MNRIVIVLALVLLPRIASADCRVTTMAINKLHEGMTYQEVVQLFGCEGDHTAHSPGSKTDTLSDHYNFRSGAGLGGVLVIFHDGKLSDWAGSGD
jgi:hypothetical protein